MAVEIGNTAVDPQEPSCLCGKHGSVDNQTSDPYLAQYAHQKILLVLDKLAPGEEPLKSNGRFLLHLTSENLNHISGETISAVAAQGNQLAKISLNCAS
jgi:predicted NBD/HSP70 family sugar kinase